MRRPLLSALPLALALTGLAGCGDDGETAAGFDDAQIVEDFADEVVIPTYTLLATRADALQAAVTALAADTSDANLLAARNAWIAARAPWEQSEAFLFGPVDSFGYDPALDSWPVNETDLLAVLNSGDTINEAYVANLSETQKGFHTVEYLLFGDGGAKTAAQVTARQLEYLGAITAEFADVAHALVDSWTTGAAAYREVFVSAGAGSAAYPSRGAAAQEILGGMIGICDEVANGKIADPYDAHDPDLVESQFSYNSLTDFQDNMRSVLAAYTGGSALAGTDGRGLADWIAERDAALDTRVKAEIAAAIAAIAAIPAPFRTAITTPSSYDEIEAAQAAIRELQATLEGPVSTLVLQ